MTESTPAEGNPEFEEWRAHQAAMKEAEQKGRGEEPDSETTPYDPSVSQGPDTETGGYDPEQSGKTGAEILQDTSFTDTQTKSGDFERDPNRIPGETPESGDRGNMSESDVKRLIDQAREEDRQQHEKEVDSLRQQITSIKAGLPQSLIPENAGGFGVDSVAETWSQYDQELSRQGEHPFQDGDSADWLAHPDDVEERQGVKVRKSAG